MFRHFRYITQVVALTFVLLFGALLMVGSFETPGWSDPVHVVQETTHETVFYFYLPLTTTHYVHSGHGDTSH